MDHSQDIIDDLNRIKATAWSHAQAEPDLDARRVWIRLETAVEELLVFYGQQRAMAAPAEEQIRQQVHAELVAAGWQPPALDNVPEEVQGEERPSFWDRIFRRT